MAGPLPPPSNASSLNASAGQRTKHKVILPEGLSGHHSVPHHPDPWHQWEGFVVILVLLHVAVLSFYAWMLYQDKKDKKDKKRAGAGAGKEVKGGKGGGSGSSSPGLAAWRTPKDILEKQRLGKV